MRKSLTLFILSLFLSFSATQAFAQGWTNPNCFYQDGADQVATIGGVECVVENILRIAIPIIGVVVLVMIVWGSFNILISAGNPQEIEKGKSIFYYAIMGLVIALLSFFIINLIALFTGNTSILDFSIGGGGSSNGGNTNEPFYCAPGTTCNCNAEPCVCGSSVCSKTCLWGAGAQICSG